MIAYVESLKEWTTATKTSETNNWLQECYRIQANI